MIDDLQPILNRLPARASVSLALASAARALKALQRNSAVYSAAKTALKDAWQWEVEQNISASQLYKHIYPLLLFEHTIDKDSAQLSALFSTVSAMYYVTWIADGYERLEPNSQSPLLPNDIAEISADTLSECLAFASQTVEDQPSETNWQVNAIHKLIANDEVDTAESLKTPIFTEFFEDI